MLELTRGSNYSFHALLLLARAEPARTMTIDELAQGVRASPSYMAKLLKRLSRAGLVMAHLGRGGGYGLGRPADVITLWEVVAALHDGVPVGTPVIPLCAQCPLSPICPLRDTLHSAEEDIRHRLEAVTVGSLAQLLDQNTLADSSQGSGKAGSHPWLSKQRSGAQRMRQRR